MISSAITAMHALPDWFMWFNAFAWILSNVLVGIIAVLVVIFVFVYVTLWDPGATTGGKLIFRFMVSLIGVIGLVAISLFLDPVSGREWYSYSGDTLWWRPTVRLLVYAYVVIKVVQLIVFLIRRKFWPHTIKKKADIIDDDLPLKDRHLK